MSDNPYASTVWACMMVGQAWALHFFFAGLISIALTSWRGRKLQISEQADLWNMWPFPSFLAIHRALSRVPRFRKKKYRAELGRLVRSRSSMFDVQLPWWFGHCLPSPIVLVAQCFPLRIERPVVATGIDA
jgi:hypothetical protein